MLQNLDRLKIFYHVFLEKSIVAASHTLHVSQSAVSQSLQKLEKEIKSPLFTRLHKKLVPTAAGIELYGIVESFMSELDIYLKDLNQSKHIPTGELRIGAPQEFGKAYLSIIMAEFRSKYQDVRFSLEFGHPDKLLPMLREGKIDFILLDEFIAKSPYSGSLEEFLFEPVIEEKVILACSSEYYRKNISGKISYSSLSGQDFIGYTKDHQFLNEWCKVHFSRSFTAINGVMTVDNHEAVVSAIMHSLGMGIVTTHLVQEELDSGSMIKIETAKPDIINTISLVQILNKTPTLAEKLFSGFLIERIQSMTAQGGSYSE
jgi:DNA-binding transcriptional LysR family regulator